MSRQVKRIVHQIIPVLSALVLLVGCGGEDPAGGAGYEKGLPVVDASALVEAGKSPVDFLDAPADVYEGGIQIWFYRDQPFTGWAVAKHPNGKLKLKEFLRPPMFFKELQAFIASYSMRDMNNKIPFIEVEERVDGSGEPMFRQSISRRILSAKEFSCRDQY